MAYAIGDLASTLATSTEDNYVRVVADWLSHGALSSEAPAVTADPVPDALVAAAAAHLARSRGLPPPDWTLAPERRLDAFWHPGSDRFFAYSLAHAPAEFAARGLIIERDSLASV